MTLLFLLPTEELSFNQEPIPNSDCKDLRAVLEEDVFNCDSCGVLQSWGSLTYRWRAKGLTGGSYEADVELQETDLCGICRGICRTETDGVTRYCENCWTCPNCSQLLIIGDDDLKSVALEVVTNRRKALICGGCGYSSSSKYRAQDIESLKMLMKTCFGLQQDISFSLLAEVARIARQDQRQIDDVSDYRHGQINKCIWAEKENHESTWVRDFRGWLYKDAYELHGDRVIEKENATESYSLLGSYRRRLGRVRNQGSGGDDDSSICSVSSLSPIPAAGPPIESYDCSCGTQLFHKTSNADGTEFIRDRRWSEAGIGVAICGLWSVQGEPVDPTREIYGRHYIGIEVANRSQKPVDVQLGFHLAGTAAAREAEPLDGHNFVHGARIDPVMWNGLSHYLESCTECRVDRVMEDIPSLCGSVTPILRMAPADDKTSKKSGVTRLTSALLKSGSQMMGSLMGSPPNQGLSDAIRKEQDAEQPSPLVIDASRPVAKSLAKFGFAVLVDFARYGDMTTQDNVIPFVFGSEAGVFPAILSLSELFVT